MKNLILVLFFITSICSAQTAIYNKTKTEGKFTEYQTKSGNIIKIGDTITINYPRGENFTFISQGDLKVSATLSNSKVVVSKIKLVGNPTRGYKTYVFFKGYGFNCDIDYESALEVGEIKNPFE